MGELGWIAKFVLKLLSLEKAKPNLRYTFM